MKLILPMKTSSTLQTISALLTIAGLTIGWAGTLLGQQPEKCGSHQAILYQERLTPGYMQLVNQQFEDAKRLASARVTNTVYTIPVVVHIVYNTPAQNLADSVVFNQLATLNEDFQRLNSDTVNMRPVFDMVKGNPHIQFELATVDPSGITRTATSQASFGSSSFFSGDYSDLEKVKSTANGGIDPWDQSRYMNIWVCNMEIFNQPFIQGYATPPLNLPNWQMYYAMNYGISDGVNIQYQYFGSNNPNPIFDLGVPAVNKGRILTHEAGHYLGLRHIWGDGDCTQEDGIGDTPNADAANDFGCPFSNNTCVDNILGTDLPDMVENFMDYSDQTCTNSFTQGQVDVMRSVLVNQRADLVSGITAADVSGNVSNDNLVVYPHPFSSSFTVQVEEEGSMELMDVYGHLLLKEPVTMGDHPVMLDNLPAGTYVLRMINLEFSQKSRLVVKL
jgi:Pregnancy-associated plasma protein-A